MVQIRILFCSLLVAICLAFVFNKLENYTKSKYSENQNLEIHNITQNQNNKFESDSLSDEKLIVDYYVHIIENPIYFKFHKTTLTNDQKIELNNKINIINIIKDKINFIEICGYSDDIGSNERKYVVSKERAINTKDYISKFISDINIKYSGMSDFNNERCVRIKIHLKDNY